MVRMHHPALLALDVSQINWRMTVAHLPTEDTRLHVFHAVPSSNEAHHRGVLPRGPLGQAWACPLFLPPEPAPHGISARPS
jgi:hypothetical protein